MNAQIENLKNCQNQIRHALCTLANPKKLPTPMKGFSNGLTPKG